MKNHGRQLEPPRDSKAALRKTRLQDIAEIAGVGIATVDRVLNERGNVSAGTAERVLVAARRLKLKRILPSSYHRLLRIEVLLARPELPLIDRMNREFTKLAEQIDRSVMIQRTLLPNDSPKLLSERIRTTTCEAVIVYAQEHDAIHAGIDVARQRGVVVVTMISDLPRSARLAYAGTDHHAAGRTAGFFMARMVHEPGPLIVLCNHFGIQSHEQRVRGFREVLTTCHPALRIVHVVEGGDDSWRSERLLRECFGANPDAVGFYNVGAANDAAGNVLRSGLLKHAPVFIGHELTHETRPMLQDGLMSVVIDQNPEQQSRFAIDILLHYFGYTDNTWLEEPYKSRVPFTLYTRENLPD